MTDLLPPNVKYNIVLGNGRSSAKVYAGFRFGMTKVFYVERKEFPAHIYIIIQYGISFRV